MLSPEQWTVIKAISDCIIQPLSIQELDAVNPESSQEDKQQLAGVAGGHAAQYEKAVTSLLSQLPQEKVRLLGLVIKALNYRVSAAPLTRSHKLLTEMTLTERQQVIKSWQMSPLGPLNMLAQQLITLSMFAFYYGNPNGMPASGFNVENPIFEKISLGELYVPKFIETFNNEEVFDVIIVGSGCGGGVAAYEAARAGFKVLIVEKAKYIAPQDMANKSPRDLDELTLESAGAMMSDDGSLSVLAGSTVGGGGAVNWSCSLRTPQGIRREWSEDVPFYNTTVYDDALDYVCEAMGVTTDIGVGHSFTNSLILESCATLEYPAKVAPQNTGKHPHNNRFHGFGYRKGEKGGIAVWLDSASERGALMASGAGARRIIGKNGKAVGVELDVNGKTIFVKAKRIVSSGGSLNTPILMQRSGFRNKHIGKHLKLHPVTTVHGDYDEVVNRNDDPIMTTVSSVVDNLDGHYHGPKIEAMHHVPHLIGKFLPFKDGEQYAKDLARYSHLSSLLVITRDEGEGQVWFDKSAPMSPRVAYTTSKYDLWALREGCVVAANIEYVGGAKRIIMPDASLPVFHSSKPKADRRINDGDYQDWIKIVEKQVFYNQRLGLGSAHQMGSCRMSGKGPGHGAVDTRGRLYECKNVHVIDASVLPTASGVNPMISTLATGKVLADELVKALKTDATKL